MTLERLLKRSWDTATVHHTCILRNISRTQHIKKKNKQRISGLTETLKANHNPAPLLFKWSPGVTYSFKLELHFVIPK